LNQAADLSVSLAWQHTSTMGAVKSEELKHD